MDSISGTIRIVHFHLYLCQSYNYCRSYNYNSLFTFTHQLCAFKYLLAKFSPNIEKYGKSLIACLASPVSASVSIAFSVSFGAAMMEVINGVVVDAVVVAQHWQRQPQIAWAIVPVPLPKKLPILCAFQAVP